MIAMLLLCVLAAQSESSRLTFEVASIKPAGPWVPGQPSQRGGPGTSDPGRVTFPRATLSDLLMRAYGVWIDQISGPAWLSDSVKYSYTVTATMPAGTSTEQYRMMLQDLLAERFHVRLHHAQQMRPAFELTIAEGGHKLKEWFPPAKEEQGTDMPKVDSRGFVKLKGGESMAFIVPMSGHGAIRTSHRLTMADFCRGLGASINSSNGIPIDGGAPPRVIDRTGLAGAYEFTLEYAGVMFSPAALAVSAPPADVAVPAAADPPGAPDIFVAVEKQLGLKLRKTKDVAIDVLVIDGADKVPTEN